MLQVAQVIFLCVNEYLTAWRLHGSKKFETELNIHHLGAKGASENLHQDTMAK